jgi:hypothetical protein
MEVALISARAQEMVVPSWRALRPQSAGCSVPLSRGLEFQGSLPWKIHRCSIALPLPSGGDSRGPVRGRRHSGTKTRDQRVSIDPKGLPLMIRRSDFSMRSGGKVSEDRSPSKFSRRLTESRAKRLGVGGSGRGCDSRLRVLTFWAARSRGHRGGKA